MSFLSFVITVDSYNLGVSSCHRIVCVCIVVKCSDSLVAAYAPWMCEHVLWCLLLQHRHLLLEQSHSLLCFEILCHVYQKNHSILSFIVVFKRMNSGAKKSGFES